jgi:hypothetical protein
MDTTTAIARAAHIGPRTRLFVLNTPDQGPITDGRRYDLVLAALCRSDITPTLSARTHTVAYALRKCMTSARMPATSVMRIADYSPYALCRLVAHIARECPETTIGGICDGWLMTNHASF